jgi:RNA polymerase sigma-70 factor (ECF subfamily)
LRLARPYGIASEATNDVVQETLLEAWRHLDVLVEPDGFTAWLAAICRNICQRYHRAHSQVMQHELPWGWSSGSPWEEENGTWPFLDGFDFPDPSAVDPLEELDRQDLATLLDHALGHLPRPSREAIALCYLAELTQREAAQRLQLTIQALEARLHRARNQLRQILSGPLRSEAQALGVTVDVEVPAGWHDTRLWCPSCGKARFIGVFEHDPGSNASLRLRCAGCRYEVNSWGMCPWIICAPSAPPTSG